MGWYDGFDACYEAEGTRTLNRGFRDRPVLRWAGKFLYFLGVGFAASGFTLVWYEIGEYRLRQHSAVVDEARKRRPVRAPTSLPVVEAQPAYSVPASSRADALAVTPSSFAPASSPATSTQPRSVEGSVPTTKHRHYGGPNPGL